MSKGFWKGLCKNEFHLTRHGTFTFSSIENFYVFTILMFTPTLMWLCIVTLMRNIKDK